MRGAVGSVSVYLVKASMTFAAQIITRTAFLLAVSIHCAVVAAEGAPASKPSTRPSSTGFLAALDKPYEDAYLDRRAAGWARLFNEARTLDDRAVDLKARDRLVRSIGEFVDQQNELKRDLRIVIVEVLDQNGNNRPRYDRAAVFSYLGKSSKDLIQLSKMGFAEVASEEFKRMEKPLLVAMKAGGSNNGVKSVGDAVEALVLTCFDGSEWRTETWFWPVTGAALAVEEGRAEIGRRDTLAEPLRCLLDVLDVVQPYGSDSKGFGPPPYRTLLKDFPRTQALSPAKGDTP